jgi:uracil-DNA glycosylase
MDVEIEASWKEVLKDEFDKPYFKDLMTFVKNEYQSHTVYPEPQNIFKTFELTPFGDVRVVILGQDPYHGARQAIGLSFAVAQGAKIPPSLRNIFAEVVSDLEKPLEHTDGDLSRWAKQGVLLLNATLTVCEGEPASHQGYGWEHFTDVAIKALSDRREHLVFILWGKYARAKAASGLIDRTRHLVLESVHPSPLSVRHGFAGSKPFSKTNQYLEELDGKPIDWA